MGHAGRGHPQFNMGGDETEVRIAGFISYSTFISVAITNTEHKMVGFIWPTMPHYGPSLW